ncbi:MAG: nucleotidyltransferase domain-containing protein [Nitrospinota bacterium]
MKNKVLKEKLDLIIKQVINKYKPSKIILFGSASKGGEINDIDLLLIKENVPYYGVDRMREVYHLIETDVAVDFLVYKPDEFSERLALGDPFVKEVIKKGKVLYG